MWQLPDDDAKYWMDVLDMDDNRKLTAAVLLKSDLAVLESSFFTHLAGELFDVRPVIKQAYQDTRALGNKNSLEAMIRKQKRGHCGAAKIRPIFSKEDMNESYLYHLAWELDILAAAGPK